MLEIAVFEETESETVDCQECGKENLPEFGAYFNGSHCGRYIGESGYYCDDCYPRCYCPDCA